MDFRFTDEQEDFRQEIRAFLDDALPETPEIPEDGWIVGFDKAFSRKVGAKGWIGLTWPKEAGGQGRSYLYAPAYTIQGGTSTILRTIVAQRGLGLPPG